MSDSDSAAAKDTMIRRLWSGVKPVLAFLVALPMACLAEAPMATTASGPVQGLDVNGVDVFRGIPFTAPPVGALRWREPQSVEKWTATRQTTAAGPSCIQKPGMSSAITVLTPVWWRRSASILPLRCKKWARCASWFARCIPEAPTRANLVAKWHATRFSRRSRGGSLICTAPRAP